MPRRPEFDRPDQGFDPISPEPVMDRREPRPAPVGPLVESERGPIGAIIDSTKVSGPVSHPGPGMAIVRDASEKLPCYAGKPFGDSL